MNTLTKNRFGPNRQAEKQKQPRPAEALQSAVHEMLQCILHRRRPTVETLHVVWEALDALPLASMDYYVLEKRILNAVDYCRQREFGAAKFELTMLSKCLPN